MQDQDQDLFWSKIPDKTWTKMGKGIVNYFRPIQSLILLIEMAQDQQELYCFHLFFVVQYSPWVLIMDMMETKANTNTKQ